MKKFDVRLTNKSGVSLKKDSIQAETPEEAYNLFVESNKPLPYERINVFWGMLGTGAQDFDPPHYDGHDKDAEELTPAVGKPRILKTHTLTAHRDDLRNNTAYPILRAINLLNSVAIVLLSLFWGIQTGDEAVVIFGIVGVVVAILSYSLTSVFFDVADSNINTSKNSERKE